MPGHNSDEARPAVAFVRFDGMWLTAVAGLASSLSTCLPYHRYNNEET